MQHLSIYCLELATNMEKQGKEIFRAPSYIQNDPIYIKFANEVITDTQLKYKSDLDLVKKYKSIINTWRKDELTFPILNDFKLTYQNFYIANIHTYLHDDAASV